MVGLFREFPPRTVEISLYGAHRKTYERISGVRGSFERCMNGIHRLLDGGINVRLKTVLMSLNRHEFFEIESVARALGVKFRFDAVLMPCLDGDKKPLRFRVPPAEAVRNEFVDSTRRKIWEHCAKQAGEIPGEALYRCEAGRTGFHIDAYGNLQPCLMTRRYRSSLAEKSFLEGWNGNPRRIMDARPCADFRCIGCEKRTVCGYCPAFFELENGSEYIASEYICEMANRRFRKVQQVV